ncbi:cuticle protein 8-like [Panulirus ornatus]|uniref:cuticle protein 8-like n=1 Tax=Panulirus ornatus TaxID=150431 RepID=UPI003A87D5D7
MDQFCLGEYIFVLAALMVVASAEILPGYIHPVPSYNDDGPVGPAQYSFSWNVQDDYAGNNYGQEETRNGYDTQGYYYVHLSDGRIQKISYVVSGDSGFLADVEYQGDAHYPAPQHGTYNPGPTYQSPTTPTYG